MTDPNILFRKVGDELQLLNLRSGVGFKINGMAVHLWLSFQTPRPLEDHIATVMKELKIKESDQSRFNKDATKFYKSLLEKKCVVLGE